MPRTTPNAPDAAQDDASVTQAGFDAMVHVPAGASVDEAIAGLADDEAPTTPTTAYTDAPEFDADEVGYPRLRLGQGLTAEVAEGNAKMGQWLISGYEPMDEVTIIPLMFARDREMKGGDQKRDDPVVCRSSDARIGVGTPGGSCKACPFAKWSNDPKTGARKPPACKIAYHYGSWVVDVETLAEVTFTRTSEQYAQMVNNLVQKFGLGRFAIRLTSVIKSAPQRRWAEPQLRIVKLTYEMAEPAVGLIPLDGLAPTRPALPAGSLGAVNYSEVRAGPPSTYNDPTPRGQRVAYAVDEETGEPAF